MSEPFVTVLIDTYNHERFIEQAVTSVLEQDFPPSEMEILVVDDGSTDHTPEILRKFAPRVRHLRKENGGQASAFNAGIPEARGEIVAFLDGDDWWAKNKLSTVVDVLAKHSDIGVVGHGIFEADSAGGKHTAIVPKEGGRLALRSVGDALSFRHLMCFFGTSRVAIRKHVLEGILPVPEAIVIEADEFVATMSLALSEAMLLESPLTFYRLHGENLFQFKGGDAVKLRRKHDSLEALLEHLPRRLQTLGLPSEAAAALVERIWVDAERLRLILDGGKPWETFRVERADFRIAYQNAGVGYHLFKRLVLALTIVMPPPWFYRLRDWYADRGLRRARAMIGEPVPAAPILKQQEIGAGK